MKHKYLNRRFLSPASSGLTSYILAEVESTRNGEYKFGNNMLTIGDCKRSIQLEFFLGTAKARKQSYSKICQLISDLINFGAALKKEKELIEQFERAKRKRKGKKREGKK